MSNNTFQLLKCNASFPQKNKIKNNQITESYSYMVNDGKHLGLVFFKTR